MFRTNDGARGTSVTRDPAVTTAGNVRPAQGWLMLPRINVHLEFLRLIGK